jgi:glutamate/tyrosine decarboxylase-like PLP-dependent enzyme
MAHQTSFNDLALWDSGAELSTEQLSQAIGQLLPKLFELSSSGWKGKLFPADNKDYDRAHRSLADTLHNQGLGLGETTRHLLQDIVPGLNAMSLSPHYYGFVVGGVTPAAALADNIVTAFDQSVTIHLPKDTIATVLETRATQQLLELLDLDVTVWKGQTLTTGATASNVLGMACGREYVINQALRRKGKDQAHAVSRLGLLAACREAGIDEFQILSALPHSSLIKAASIVGLGRGSFRSVGKASTPFEVDIHLLADALRSKPTAASIVLISCGEINTGRFSTTRSDMERIRALCDEYGAWMHVDGAFGLFARLLPSTEEFEDVKRGVAGMELADSITGDAHKLLNVPYESGFFFCKSREIMESVFQNSGAAYLSTGDGAVPIPSALNLGIENSRRFRALPIYASLMAYGRLGYRGVLEKQVRLTRRISDFILNHPSYELLGFSDLEQGKGYERKHIFMILMFRAQDTALNEVLTQRLNQTRRLWVSGTSWDGRPATRIAVANWRVDVERDFSVVEEVFNNIIKDSVI